MDNLVIIAAVGKNLELGKDNKLIWHFKNDMRFFKENTMYKPIVMGRKTFESLPGLLPNRKHIVLTRNGDKLPKEVTIFKSIDEVLEYVKDDADEVMVIGGASVYLEFLKYARKILLTEIEAECKDADAYFPYFNKDRYHKKLVSEYVENNISYKHFVYVKKDN